MRLHLKISARYLFISPSTTPSGRWALYYHTDYGFLFMGKRLKYIILCTSDMLIKLITFWFEFVAEKKRVGFIRRGAG